MMTVNQAAGREECRHCLANHHHYGDDVGDDDFGLLSGDLNFFSSSSLASDAYSFLSFFHQQTFFGTLFVSLFNFSVLFLLSPLLL